MTDNKEWTPEEIAALRARLGMTRVQFGQRLGGLDPSTVWRWETGQRAPERTAHAMMTVLDKWEG